MFQREIHAKLRTWRDSKDRKPLILRGARQVGKTIAVEVFAGRFERFVKLNLDLAADAELFRRRLDIKDLYQAILLKNNALPTGGRTLLFLDEIQNCPEAVSSLRYFREDLPEVFVIAAGSLLEIALHEKQIEFPVGRVEHLFMYPLSFREFLVAANETAAAKAYDTVPVPDYAFPTLIEQFHRYTLIGGMPEIVARYIEKRDITALKPVYNSLLTSYLDDVAKYARNTSMAAILRHCIEAAPLAAGQRIQFAGFGNSNYRSREVGEALRTLQRAMLIHLLYPCTTVEIPALPDLKKSPRLQFLDTGLLNYFAGLQEEFFRHDDLRAIYRGMLAEHVVAQELICMEPNIHRRVSFWVREKTQSQAEVDFIVQHKGRVIPVEVKAGKAGSLRSLHEFMDRCPHGYAVRLCAAPLSLHPAKTAYGKHFQLLSVPYFAAAQVHEYIDWMISQV
ncbi:MAG: AAA family ATPase [Verrucomicrobia bacterium]|nr:AAA family ATPase [Verrucomicrobiota bacterium]